MYSVIELMARGLDHHQAEVVMLASGSRREQLLREFLSGSATPVAPPVRKHKNSKRASRRPKVEAEVPESTEE